MAPKKRLSALAPEDPKEFEPEAKIGLLATIDPNGLPHISLITSMRAKTPQRLMWGQFTEGCSKRNVRSNPRAGWLVLTMDKKMWRGKALWTGDTHQGEDYELYNNTPMFRYNAYFGIHTVHYMDLVETFGRESLPMGGIVSASILTKALKGLGGGDKSRQVLKPWAQGLFNKLDALKFLGFVDSDGYPAIVPLIQCQAASSSRLAFSPMAYGDEIKGLQPGAHLAVFGLTMQMEDVLVRGVFGGYKGLGPARLGVLDIDWVYNSMPPQQGPIYPPQPLEAVTEF